MGHDSQANGEKRSANVGLYLNRSVCIPGYSA
jgi:hypothetical protein